MGFLRPLQGLRGERGSPFPRLAPWGYILTPPTAVMIDSSSLPHYRLDHRRPDLGRGVVHGDDHDSDGYDSDAGLLPLGKVDVLDEQEADAAAAYEADDGGHTYVDVPAVEGE